MTVLLGIVYFFIFFFMLIGGLGVIVWRNPKDKRQEKRQEESQIAFFVSVVSLIAIQLTRWMI